MYSRVREKKKNKEYYINMHDYLWKVIHWLVCQKHFHARPDHLVCKQQVFHGEKWSQLL